MANKLTFTFVADTKNFQSGLAKLGRTTTNVVKGVGVATTTAVTASLVAFSKFQSRMSDVATLIDTSTESISDMSNEILEMSERVPKSIDDLTSALYDVRSAGVAAEDSMLVLEESARLATAGLSTTKESVNIMTSSLNAFSNEGLTASQISDVLFTTVKQGKTTVSDLSGSFGNVAAIVSDSNVKFDDFNAATAALTTTGQSASEAQNGLRAALVSMLKPTAEMQDIFKELGVKDGRELINTSDGLGDAFSKIKNTADEMGIEISKATGRIQGANAITSLAGATNAKYLETLADMRDGISNVDLAFAKQTETLEAQTQLIKNNFNKQMIEFGSKIAPEVIKNSGSINSAIEKIGELAVSSVGPLIKGFNTFLDVILSLQTAVALIIGGFETFFMNVGFGFRTVGGVVLGFRDMLLNLIDTLKIVALETQQTFAIGAKDDEIQSEIDLLEQKKMFRKMDRENQKADYEEEKSIAREQQSQKLGLIWTGYEEEMSARAEQRQQELETDDARHQEDLVRKQNQFAAEMELTEEQRLIMQELDQARRDLDIEIQDIRSEEDLQRLLNLLKSKEHVTEQDLKNYEKYIRKQAELDKKGNKDKKDAKHALNTIEQAFQAQSLSDNKVFAVGLQAIQIGKATMSTYEGASNALKDYPYPYNIVVAGLVTAAGLANVASIASQSFAVGTDFVPNDMVANIHKGESIIPARANQFLQSGKMKLVPRSDEEASSSSSDIYLSVNIENANGSFNEEDSLMIAEQISDAINENRFEGFPQGV